jgi:hypothetical protein
MFKKGLIAIVLGLTLFLSTAQCGEVRVMVGYNLIKYGNDCKLIPSEEFHDADLDERLAMLKKGSSLKEMVSKGWKIDYAERMPGKYFNSILFIFTK